MEAKMSTDEADVQQQFAANVAEYAIREMKDRLERESQADDKPIKEAWDSILAIVNTFGNKKAKMFASLQQIVGPLLSPAQTEALQTELNQMAPPTFTAIVHQIKHPSPIPADGASPDTIPFNSPKIHSTAAFAVIDSPNDASPQIALNCSAGSPTTIASPTTANVPGNSDQSAKAAARDFKKPIGTAKRSRPGTQMVDPSAPGRKKTKTASPEVDIPSLSPTTTTTITRPPDLGMPTPRSPPFVALKNPDIDMWEVEGVDYIFPYPAFGNGWFVLRCGTGEYTAPYSFKTHPFEGSPTPANAHFIANVERCRSHSDIKLQKPGSDEILMSYGRRVSGDHELNQAWVDNSNSRIEAERQKQLTPKKTRRQELGVANRTSMDRVTSVIEVQNAGFSARR
ncbi:hypothetical protein B0T22DRAFT_295071 [Podospora appendiculata]|uniref:Uncharacterized protein n=1 Tax=Podospora appendiculata TaxID=314037 RepID=A0AAE0X255_9PEZI|nr:hypothetical protein B0T22DRAFT_295071 [Podospora appendiculata]